MVYSHKPAVRVSWEGPNLKAPSGAYHLSTLFAANVLTDISKALVLSASLKHSVTLVIWVQLYLGGGGRWEHTWRCLGTHSWWYLNYVVHCSQAEQWWGKKMKQQEWQFSDIENVMLVNRYMQFWNIFQWDSDSYYYKFAPSSFSLYLGSLMLPLFPENLLRRTNLLVTCIVSLLSSFSWTQRAS